MEITHLDGKSVDTNKLSDVDALLMEETKKLHDVFAKYNRQVFIIGEMKSTEKSTAENGCAFFHIGEPGMNKEQFLTNFNRFFYRMDMFIRDYTSNNLFIGSNTNKTSSM